MNRGLKFNVLVARLIMCISGILIIASLFFKWATIDYKMGYKMGFIKKYQSGNAFSDVVSGGATRAWIVLICMVAFILLCAIKNTKTKLVAAALGLIAIIVLFTMLKSVKSDFDFARKGVWRGFGYIMARITSIIFLVSYIFHTIMDVFILSLSKDDMI